ncbi:MAG: hypothetical protein IPK20_23040 [Betaproteobacteria bacterium]|nr:hypothetical protein [Betaproteobacteria bacterium]
MTAPAFHVPYRHPYDFPALLAFLGRRAIDGVEQVSANRYRRSVRLHTDGLEVSGCIDVTDDPEAGHLVVVTTPGLEPAAGELRGRLSRLFDADTDPAPILACLGPLATNRPGLRLPGAFDGFEMAVRAILGQQITVRAATTLAGRLAQTFGDPLSTGDGVLRCTFPDARRMSDLEPSAIAEQGVIRARATAIVELARALKEGRILLEPVPDPEREVAELLRIPGIGPWTAHYLAMRALRWHDAFPDGDYGVRKALGTVSRRELLEQAERWRPFRARAVMHLWHCHGGGVGGDTEDG